MKAVTVYEASDGRRFDKQKDCEVYEADGCVEFHPIPKYCDHVPLTDEALRWMSQGDGSCHYATATRFARGLFLRKPHPAWATHLVYFGK